MEEILAHPHTALIGLDRVPRILVGACGAINIINLHHYVGRLCAFADVNVVMTNEALKLVQPRAIQAITGKSIYTSEDTYGLPVPHRNLAAWPHLILVLPATANSLAKAATGFADDLLSTVILAAESEVWFVPSMSLTMWLRAAVQRNVQTLEQDGYRVIRAATAQETLELSTGVRVSNELMPSAEELSADVRAALGIERRAAQEGV
jgi:phosphopantothenoylcysteine synthetase/decarboxylase